MSNRDASAQKPSVNLLKEIPIRELVEPSYLEKLTAERVNPKTHYRVPKDIYTRIMNWTDLPCIDNWIFDVNTGRVLVSIRNYQDSTPGALWPAPGGRMQFGETTADTIARLFHDELGIKVNLTSSEMIAIGYGVYWYNGRRQTPNYTFVHRMKVPHDFKIQDKQHFLGYTWVGPEDLHSLRENTATVYPYVVQMLEAIFSGIPRTSGTLYHNEETGINVPENRKLANVGEAQKDLRVRLVGRTTERPDVAFQRYIDTHIPRAMLEAIVLKSGGGRPQMLFRNAPNGVAPVIIYERQPYDETPETATLRLAYERTGVEFTNPYTIGVKNEIQKRHDGTVISHDVVQVRTIMPAFSQLRDPLHGWMDLGLAMPKLEKADPTLAHILRHSGLLEGNVHGPTRINDFINTVDRDESELLISLRR